MSFKYKCAVAALVLPVWAGIAVAAPCGAPSSAITGYTAGQPLTLDGAIARVRAASPEVRAAALEASARSADADQAGRWLNPALSVEVENFAGRGPLKGFSQSETTLTLEQTFRLGGKRRLSERAARAEAALATAECGVMLREAELAAAEGVVELDALLQLALAAREAATLATDLAGTVGLRVEAGAAAPPERSRAQAEAALLEAAAAAAEAEVEIRAYALAALWGDAAPDFTLPNSGVQLAADANAAGTLGTHPRLEAATAAADAGQAAAALARAGAVPDVTVSAGWRRMEEIGEDAFTAGISVPLPLFDRNKDAARAAGLRRDGAALSAQATEARLQAEQSAAAARVRAAEARLQILESKALPDARSAYQASAEGYRIGRFDLTSTLDARRSLIETETQVIEARAAVATETLRLRALIGAAPFAGEK
ncbi:TolC family protein [Hyphomonas sp. WL0036]|uniref:TolC family protein n=1 Tax=Hyphomonas sediminis TaxID=2866160 RepID=UPI001C824578|nr:TolC family protein [Hyphomonas sediminis]MBY9068035.1 TolC family protein [Hyphomonas sediminis]